MADSLSNDEYIATVYVWKGDVCTIHATRDPGLASTLLGWLGTYTRERGTPTGLLLELSSQAPISVVRLSQLMDQLGRLGCPMAVVLPENKQQLARLLHHTLIYSQHIAYVDTMADAWEFVESHSRSRSRPGSYS